MTKVIEARVNSTPQPIKALRGNGNDESFHGYVEDQSGSGKTAPELAINPLNLALIECGLGSTATKKPDIIPSRSVDYPDPFASRMSLQIMESRVQGLDTADIDPDQIIIRTSLAKIINEMLTVVPNPQAERVFAPTDAALLLARANRSEPAVFFIDGDEAVKPNEFGQLIRAAETNGHLVVKKNGDTIDPNQSENLIQVGEHQIHNTDSTIGYAVVGKTVLQAYNPYRMVFMLPQYRLEETRNYSTPEIEFSAKKLIIDLNHLIATPDQLIFGEGSYDALDQMLQSFGNLGYNQVIGRGSHFPYIQQLADRHFVNYQAVAPESSLDQTGASARLTKQLEIEDLPPSIIYLDVPSNPTGFVDSMDDLRQLIQVAQTKNHLVFIDSAYGDLLPQYQDLLNLPSQHDNVVTFGSFSKNRHLAGDRLGFAHLSKPLTNLVSQSGLPLSSTMTASGLARLQSLATIDQAEFLAASHTQVSERKQVLVDSLQELPGVRVASTDKAVSIIYVDLIDNEIKEALANLQTKNPALSIGRILKERYGVNNEPGEEFINTDPGLGATGFRLRIPPQIEQSQAIALRLNDLMNEIVNNPDAILISAN